MNLLVSPWRLADGLIDARAHLDDSRKAIEDGRLKDARFSTLSGSAAAERARQGLRGGGPLLDVARAFNKGDRVLDEVDHLVAAVEYSAAAARGSLNVAQNALRGPNKIVVPDPEDPDGGSQIRIERIEATAETLSEVRDNVELARGELEAIDSKGLPKALTDRVSQALKQTRDADETLAKAEAGFELLPRILGVDGPRNYIFGMQNSAELRGTGGSILRFARLEIDEGRPELKKNKNAYNVDKGRRTFDIDLPDDAWYNAGVEDAQRFANANWSPDWPMSAELTVRYAKEADPNFPEVDGVIAVDPVVLKNLLLGVGPIGPRITQGKVEDFLLYKAYAEYPRGRKAILKQVVEKFFKGLLKPAHPIDLVEGFSKSLSEKHMQIWMADDAEQSFIERMDWDAGIDEAKDSDYFMVVQQNVGGNKLNYVEQQEHRLEIRLDENGARNSVAIESFNNVFLPAPMHWEGDSDGFHRPMINLYVPQTARLMSAEPPETCVTLRGQEPCRSDLLPPGLVAWEGGIPAEHSELGKKVWSAGIEIPPQQRAVLGYTWESPGVVVREGDRFVYRLVLQHQPKPNPELLTVSIALPEGARDVKSLGFSRRDGRLVWDKAFVKDTVLEVTWRS